MALGNPPSIDDLPATPDRADRATFSARCVALFDQLKNTTIAQWRSAMSWMQSAVADAASSAASATASANSAASSATNAANTLAAAQSVIGATRWAAGAYGPGIVVWSPSNGQLYRSRAAIASSTVDPISDPSNWFSLALLSAPIGYVSDTAGSMYGTANGGLNMVNVITYAGACLKYLPQNPSNGDFCTITVANGRLDNAIYVNVSNPIPIAFGSVIVTDSVTIDKINDSITFKYFSALNQWRKV